MLIVLSGGPFDGRTAEKTGGDGVIPQSLGFGSGGDTLSITGAIELAAWRLRGPVMSLGSPGVPSTSAAIYQKTGRTTDAGATVFEFLAEIGRVH